MMMRIIACLCVLIIASASISAEESVAKMPPVLKLKDEKAFKEHFDAIIQQTDARKGEGSIALKEKASSLEQAFTLLAHSDDKFENFIVCIEYENWYLFSTGFEKDLQTKQDSLSLMNMFRFGTAIKKGDNKAHPFLFW
jgi:hypothetical protein